MRSTSQQNHWPPSSSLTRRALLGGGTALAVAGGLALAGCSGSGPAEATAPAAALPERLTSRAEVIIAMDPSTVRAPFDPVKGFGETGVLLFNSTLVAADGANKVVNDLATEYSVSDDGLTWTFTVRSDAMFSDGSRLTAGDVAFTYNKAKEAASVSLPGFDRAEAVDENTVRLILTEPSSTLLYTAATLGIVPEAGYDEEAFASKPIGSGPWKLADYIQGQQLILERNDDYYGTRPAFAKATLLLMEPDAALAAARSGQVDIAEVYPNLSGQQVNGFGLQSLPTFGYRVISLPCQEPGAFEVEGQQVGNAVTSDPVIRRAMATGMNRQQMIDDCLYGYGEVAFDIFDAFDWGIKEDTRQLKDGDVEAATKLLDDAGWTAGSDGIRVKDGQRAGFTLLYPTNDSGRQAIAEAFKVQMAGLGIEVQLEGGDFTWMLGRNRSDAVVLGGGRLNPYHEYTMLSNTRSHDSGWANIACYDNSTVQEHLEQALTATDQQSADEHWHKALWDGSTGGSVLGDSPYLCVGYIRHNYYVRDGLDIGTQRVHPHDHFLQVLYNLNTWDVAE
ncbi:MAG: ABC transporter substrate-binding protein [Propionibacteriaceae bacterium]|jgi:peptide/nickel transport system substrate-binding protein|nr:ABC transporter substrate-binding protein [Propionibacteriaceae bacterium]